MTLTEIATLLDGVLEGDGSLTVSGLSGLREARPTELSLLTHRRYADVLAETKAIAVLVRKNWEGESPCPVIRVANPDIAMTQVARAMAPPPHVPPPGVHPTAVVAADAVIGEGASIGPHCVIEVGASVGAKSVMYAGSYLGAGASVGS